MVKPKNGICINKLGRYLRSLNVLESRIFRNFCAVVRNMCVCVCPLRCMWLVRKCILRGGGSMSCLAYLTCCIYNWLASFLYSFIAFTAPNQKKTDQLLFGPRVTHTTSVCLCVFLVGFISIKRNCRGWNHIPTLLGLSGFESISKWHYGGWQVLCIQSKYIDLTIAWNKPLSAVNWEKERRVEVARNK